MLRFVWKETFDDRTFWAAMLSLVAKGLAILEAVGDITLRTADRSRQQQNSASQRRTVSVGQSAAPPRKKGVPITLLDDETAYEASRMATALRRAAVGRWFLENRETVIQGSILSFAPVYFAARPSGLDECFALGLGLAAMTPGAFYLIFLLLRLREMVRASRRGPRKALVRRTLMLFAMVVPCMAALTLGCVVLGITFGWRVLLVTTLMVGLDLSFLHFMKASTTEGRRLLDEIDGFRQFLTCVEKFPMDRPEAPTAMPGIYNKYLPYAIALEVEQAWSDRFLALADTVHEREFLPGSCAFYLGMWDGKPVEVVWKAEPARWNPR